MPRVAVVEERLKGGEHITLVPTGDWHLGAIDTDEDRLRRDLKAWAADPSVRLLLMGDLGDLIDYRDAKRWHPHPLPTRYQEAMLHADGGIPTETVAHAAELLEPFRGRIWGIVSGNHERSVEKHHSRSLMSELATILDCRSRLLGYGGFVRLVLRHPNFGKGCARVVIHAHHGWQGGRLSGSKVNQIDRELGWSDADILLRGHSHDRFAQIVASVRVGNEHTMDWPRVVAHTGTYKVGAVPDGLQPADRPPIDTWEETRGFRAKIDAILGPPRIVIRPAGDQGRRNAIRYEVIQ